MILMHTRDIERNKIPLILYVCSVWKGNEREIQCNEIPLLTWREQKRLLFLPKDNAFSKRIESESESEEGVDTAWRMAVAASRVGAPFVFGCNMVQRCYAARIRINGHQSGHLPWSQSSQTSLSFVPHATNRKQQQQQQQKALRYKSAPARRYASLFLLFLFPLFLNLFFSLLITLPPLPLISPFLPSLHERKVLFYPFNLVSPHLSTTENKKLSNHG